LGQLRRFEGAGDHARVRRVLAAFFACACLAGTAAGSLPRLPREGLAAQVGSKLVLADVRGRVLGSLDRFALVGEPALDQLAPGPRPLVVRDRAGRRWELRRGRLVRADGVLRLADGSPLRRVGARWVFRGARVGFVSERRDLVTFFEHRAARVLDVLTGRTAAIPFGCRAAARLGSRWLLLCGYPFGDPKAVSTVQVRDPDGTIRKLFGPAESGGDRPRGWWLAAFLSPDRSRLLLQWSGECEIPVAFLGSVAGGSVRQMAGSGRESVALGWSGTRALVELPKGVCGTGTAKAGVYAVDPATLKRTYVFRSSRFWRSVS
jgi:hypothetical protein